LVDLGPILNVEHPFSCRHDPRLAQSLRQMVARAVFDWL